MSEDPEIDKSLLLTWKTLSYPQLVKFGGLVSGLEPQRTTLYLPLSFEHQKM